MTQERFLAYEKVRESGLTNMYDRSAVIALSGGMLSREDITDIMRNYEEYAERWLESVRRPKAGKKT